MNKVHSHCIKSGVVKCMRLRLMLGKWRISLGWGGGVEDYKCSVNSDKASTTKVTVVSVLPLFFGWTRHVPFTDHRRKGYS
jgi:hypothetical protein